MIHYKLQGMSIVSTRNSIVPCSNKVFTIHAFESILKKLYNLYNPHTLSSSLKVYYTPSKPYKVSDPLYNPSEQQKEVNSTIAMLTELYFDTTYTIWITAINEAGEGTRSESMKQFVSIANNGKGKFEQV